MRIRLATAVLVVSVAVTTGCPHGAQLSRRDEAALALHRADYSAARPLLEQLHQEHPDDLDLARQWIEAEVKTGHVDETIAALTAIKLPSAANHYSLGLAYFSRAQDAGSSAVREFQAAIAMAPETAEFHHRLGIALLEAEHYAQAVPPLQRSIELAPTRAGYPLPLAQALSRTGDTQGALAALRKVLDAEPTPAEVKTARAIMDQLSDPFAHFPKAAQPNLDEGIRSLQELDAPQPAIVSFEAVLRDYPDQAIVHALLGLAYQRLDDAGRAVDEFRRAIELDPSNGKFHFYLAQVYVSHQRPQQATEELRRAINGNPLLDDAYSALGDIELADHDPRAAVAPLRVVALLRSDDANAHGKYAAALELAGDFPAAERQLKTSLELQPDSVEFMLRMGLLAVDRRDHSTAATERGTAAADAQKWLRKVLDIQPDNAIASRALEQIKAQ